MTKCPGYQREGADNESDPLTFTKFRRGKIRPLTDSDIQAISPHTLTRPANIFESVRFG